MPFANPFCFSDGQSCANFNQLALACDERWNEARRFLAEGVWQSFFTAMGRLDLASAAKQAAQEPDLDVGLTHLLEKFPADADALRPPKLGVQGNEKDLGTLEPGTSSKFELTIQNQGMLVLRGMVLSDCDWLCLGDNPGGPSSKMFQTRHKFTLPVRVLGDKVRAGRKPLEGNIVIDTNGGCSTFPVRANVPVRPFPKGQYSNDVLAGAKSPHELAVKAKANPEQAAVLFEQGAVKAWYASNGWTYPVQGTEGTGKGAVQQFFEVLGLTKPPRLEINTEKIVCRGKVGERLTKNVTISTKESRFVFAHGWSNHNWIQAGPTKSQGNTVVIPVNIEVPPRPGETVHAAVTFQGNGQQQFVVPVTLAVAEGSPALEPEFEEPRRRLPLGWIFAGIGALLLMAAGVVGVILLNQQQEPGPPPIVHNPPPPPPKNNEPWWNNFPDSKLAATVVALKESLPQHQAIFDGLAAKSDVERYKPYEDLESKLPEMAANAKARESLARFLVGCTVFEPSDLNLQPLRRALAGQLPQDGVAFRPEEKGGELERANYFLQVYFGAMTHPAIRPERTQDLANDLNRVLGGNLDPRAPPANLKEQMEKSLAERCYRNILPTASKSIEHALVMRSLLIEKYRQQLSLPVRGKVDAAMIAVGLSKGNDLWPKFEPILKTCVECNDLETGWAVLNIYENAKPDLVPKMDKILAAKWKAAGNANLSYAEKVAAVRKSLVSARIPLEERRKQLQKLTAYKIGQKKEPIPLLRDTVRLAHASTTACALFHSEWEGFDELVGKVPDIESAKTTVAKHDDEKPKIKIPKGVIRVGSESKTIQGQLLPKGSLKTYDAYLRGGRFYNILLTSRIYTTLQVENPDGTMRTGFRVGYTTRLSFVPPADGIYRILVSGALGTVSLNAIPFALQIQPQAGFRNPLLFPPPGIGPIKMPGEKPAAKPKTIEKRDLDDLASKQSAVRVAAFLKIADNVSDDVTSGQAKRIAGYLLSLKNEQKKELEDVAARLDAFGKCRNLLVALADVAAKDPITQQTTEAVVGGVLGQPLRLARDEDWRSLCRKMLLERALDLTSSGTSGADQAAKILGDMYREQGLTFGVDDPEFLAQTLPTRVLEGLIRHVATKAGKPKSAPNDKEFLASIDRQLKAAQFVADNDVAHMVLLQRLWIKVLAIYLQDQAPGPALMEIQQALQKQDGVSRNLLDQLRAGEETVLRMWVLANKLQ
jgi:hypothetical protein